MRQHHATTVFGLAASLLTVMLITGSMLPAAGAANQAAGSAFAGQVVSASGAVSVGGAATNPGHPVAGATVHLVPVTAMDVTTPMTASAIYAPPYPAEAYDEPLEDAIRLRGTAFPQSTTDAQGHFVIANVPDGKFFVHRDTRPEGYRTPAWRGPEQTKLFGRAVARSIDDDQGLEQSFCGCPVCRQLELSGLPQEQGALAADRAQARMDRAGSSRTDAGFFEAPGLLRRARIVSRGRRLHARNAPRAGGLRRRQGTTTSSSCEHSAMPGCRSRRPMPMSICGRTRATTSTSSRW